MKLGEYFLAGQHDSLPLSLNGLRQVGFRALPEQRRTERQENRRVTKAPTLTGQYQSR
jgi:hypothetical protein